MRRFAMLLLMLLVATILTGMGGLGGSPEGKVPETEENIQARVTDSAGTTTELSRFSLEGNVFIQGTLGEGKLTVFFKNIQSIEFGEADAQTVTALLKLKTGKEVALKVRKRAVFYGNTGYGAFQIRAGELRRIEIL